MYNINNCLPFDMWFVVNYTYYHCNHENRHKQIT